MSIRVMSYNVRYFGHVAPLAGSASTREGIVGITNAIAALDHSPQVICLQEVETRSFRSRRSLTPGHIGQTQLEAVMSALDWSMHEADRLYRYVPIYFPAHTYRVGAKQIYTTGLAVLVRDDLRIKLHNADSPHDITHRRIAVASRWKQSRICAHVIVSTPDGTTYDIFNTHLSLPAFISRDFYRIAGRMGHGENQLREIDTLAEFIAARRATDRYLVMGDFNALPGSPTYERVLERLDVHDPFPDIIGASLDDVRSKWPSAGFLRFRMKLDHIFAGPGLRWLDFEDTHPFGTEGRWDGLSDHVALVGRFKPKV